VIEGYGDGPMDDSTKESNFYLGIEKIDYLKPNSRS